jgi:VanZ family protein
MSLVHSLSHLAARPLIRWTVLILYTAIVFYLCFLPSSEVKSNDFLDMIYFDKWVHVMMYFGLWTLMVWTPKGKGALQTNRIQSFISAAVVSLAIGILIEFIQGSPWVGRGKDIYDVMADLAGIILAYFAWKRWENHWGVYHW